MSFTDAVQSCLSQYATFTGRARQSEYWYFALAILLASVAADIIDSFVIRHAVLQTIVSLGTFLPSVAVACRRLHDTDRSGWWQFLICIPLIGAIILIVWLASRGTEGHNRFGNPV
jgi:uncharacterized membrane protein YhaH (DUF805 family)